MATILVVDDELGIRALLSEILTDEGHTVELAEDAAQARAVRELLRHSPVSTEDYTGNEWESICADCNENVDSRGHLQRCAVAAAWRALGDPRGAADIERAHEEALREQTQHAINAANAALWSTTHDERERIRKKLDAGLLWPRR